MLADHEAASAGIFMPQRDAGADMPLSRRAAIIATYVFDGKVSKPRQLETAFGVLDVSSATGPFPPKATTTSVVVLSSTIHDK